MQSDQQYRAEVQRCLASIPEVMKSVQPFVGLMAVLAVMTVDLQRTHGEDAAKDFVGRMKKLATIYPPIAQAAIPKDEEIADLADQLAKTWAAGSFHPRVIQIATYNIVIKTYEIFYGQQAVEDFEATMKSWALQWDQTAQQLNSGAQA